MHDRSHRLAVFMTNGIGLADWQRVGSLPREVQLYRRLVDDGWQVTFYSYDRCRCPPRLGFAARVVPQWPYNLPPRLDPLYWTLLPLLRFARRAHDLVITNQAHSGWPALLAGRLWGARVIARCGYVYGESASFWGKRDLRARQKMLQERCVFRLADSCLTPTAELADWVAGHYRVPRDKIEVIPNFVDTELFRPEPSARCEVDVTCVGRLSPEKRLDLVLSALEGTPLRVRFIGAGPLAGPMRAQARRARVALEIVERVANHDLPSLLNRSRIYVIVSPREGHPKALVEAMACGRPCVVTPSPGIRNVIEHGVSGLWAEPTPAGLRAAVQQLIGDRALGRRLGRGARAVAIERYALDRVYARYRQHLGRVMAA